MADLIWYKDPKSAFMSIDNALSIIPNSSMSFQGQMNAVMRFSLYLAILIIIYERNITSAVAIIVITIVITTVLDHHDKRVDKDVHKKRESLNLHMDELVDELCVKPSQNNPMMNVLVSDYSEFPTRPRACDIDLVTKEVESALTHNVYRDVDDIYGKKAMVERPFYTMPITTIPNDQTEFANWLYNADSPGVCRDGNMAVCGQRIHRNYPGI